MVRILNGSLLLLLALPGQGDENKAKGKAPTAQQQYDALVKDYQDAVQAFQKALADAKTDEERQKLYQEKLPQPSKWAPRFVALAEQHPHDAVAADALVWVVTHVPGGSDDKDSPWRRALALLRRDHVRSKKLATVCRPLSYSSNVEAEALLRSLLDKSPHEELQGKACLALAQHLNRRLQDRPASADAAKEVEALFERAATKFGDIKLENDGTIRETAKAELFEMRFLVTGKTAPDIEGQDQDGKRFKLSDYRGKVVLIDFFSFN
jgi:hypothetical protein